MERVSIVDKSEGAPYFARIGGMRMAIKIVGNVRIAIDKSKKAFTVIKHSPLSYEAEDGTIYTGMESALLHSWGMHNDRAA